MKLFKSFHVLGINQKPAELNLADNANVNRMLEVAYYVWEHWFFEHVFNMAIKKPQTLLTVILAARKQVMCYSIGQWEDVRKKYQY